MRLGGGVKENRLCEKKSGDLKKLKSLSELTKKLYRRNATFVSLDKL